MKNVKIVFVLTLLANICACNLENPIMEKWWVEDEQEEPFYVPIIKTLPAEYIKETIQQNSYIYETIYEQLPPEVIIQQLPPEVVIKYVPEYIYETQYRTIYQTITEEPTDKEIREFIKQLPPEYIFQYLTDEQTEYIKSQIPPEVIIQQLPSEVVIQYVPEYIYETDYQTIYETITRDPTPGEIQEFIKQLPPEVVLKYLTDEQIEYIESQLPANVEYIDLPPEVIIKFDTVYQYIYETEYQTIYEEITRDPTPGEIQEFIQQLPPETILDYLTDEQMQHIKEQIPPEVIIQQLPSEVVIQYVPEYIYETDYQTIYETITRDPTPGEIQEFIKQLPPETIFQYLTDTQMKYIKEQIPPEVIIQQLPPEIWLQSISIADIEYIIFSGDATAYNVNSPTPGGTSLTTQEKATNDDILNVMAEALKSKEYMLILHGHANPVTGTAAEAAQLTQISLDRANAVSDKLKLIYKGGEPLDNRITTKGYGGVRNVSTTGSSATSSLNRRVEAILFTIDTTQMSGGN